MLTVAPECAMKRRSGVQAAIVPLGFALLGGACSSGSTLADPNAAATAPDAGDGGSADGNSDPVDGATSVDTGVPCVPAGRDLTSTPTPGRCDGNVAETCDGKTATLHRDDCGAGTCTDLELEEKKFDRDDGSGWLRTKKVRWAACVPEGAVACELEFGTSNWVVKESDQPGQTCAGDVRLSCETPNLPDYAVHRVDGSLTSDGWQLQIGAKTGWRIPTACPSGETCRKALSGDRTTCFPNTAAPCTPATALASCIDTTTLRGCSYDYGYEETVPCTASSTCQAGCPGESTCVAPGSTTCDPAIQPTACATPKSYVTCPHGCRTLIESCTTVPVFEGGTFVNKPGRCEVIGGGPRCIPADAALCNEASFVERCDGLKAIRCQGGIERADDCAATGQVCGVAGGQAGCRTTAATTCNGNGASRCEGNVAVACCPVSGESPFGNTPTRSCVPGYETRSECTQVMPSLVCKVFPGLGANCSVP
jgi:hypothetical protein